MIYEVELLPEVIDKLKETKNYISKRYSTASANKRVTDILNGLDNLSVFPGLGFDFDAKLGKIIDERVQTRGMVLKHQYIALYYIDEAIKKVYVTHLFSTKENYMKLFE